MKKLLAIACFIGAGSLFGEASYVRAEMAAALAFAPDSCNGFPGTSSGECARKNTLCSGSPPNCLYDSSIPGCACQ